MDLNVPVIESLCVYSEIDIAGAFVISIMEEKTSFCVSALQTFQTNPFRAIFR